MNEEMLAQETCGTFLTTAHLKEICRYRGFSTPPGNKDQLAVYVAARLNGTEGVSDAMRSLEQPYLAALHLIALAEIPPKVDDLGAVLHPDQGYYGRDTRGDFNRIAGGLLNRGLVLVHDEEISRFSGESRYARLAFLLPEAHRPFLSQFPVATESLGQECSHMETLTFLRQALLSAINRVARLEKDTGDTLLQRIASLFSFEQGILTVGGTEPSGGGSLVRQARRLWIHFPSRKGKRREENALAAAAHILSHLPEQRGCTVGALEQGIRRLGLDVRPEDLERFCSDGWQAGFLVRSGTQANLCYAAAPGVDRPADVPIVLSADAQGIFVDIECTGFDALFEVARVSLAEIAGGRLRFVPDILRMGRNAAQVEASRALAEVRRLCPGYDKAARYVLERRGKLILHEGLALFRVDDLGLRTQLLHRFPGKIRSLSGRYLASPRKLRDEIENFTRKQGFAPRNVS